MYERKILIKILVFFFVQISIASFGAFLKDKLVNIMQPNGTELEVYVTGDEFYNWLHDINGYVIIQNSITGYYCYAIIENDEFIASKFIVGEIDPKITDLVPNIKLSSEKILAIRDSVFETLPKKRNITTVSEKIPLKSSSILNTIIIYISFADQDEFPLIQEEYSSFFNSTIVGANSVRNYFKEVSYNKIDVVSSFYPTNNGINIISYKDIYNRNYFLPRSESNESGYYPYQRAYREQSLFNRAINYIKNQIPTTLNIDFDDDGYVDNVLFIIRGHSVYNTILYPHMSILSTVNTEINGKIVWGYSLATESDIMVEGVGQVCHEIFHVFGAPDLYHYNYDGFLPVGEWDIMENHWDPPQHMGAYMKYKYGGWIDEIPEIVESGTYTLNPLTSPTNNCYKIKIKNSTEYLVLEYRNREGTFESSVPNRGLIFYRINEDYCGNSAGAGAGGVTDEVYIFRFNGSITSDGNDHAADFSLERGRTEFNNNTNPYCFTSNGSRCKIFIKNVTSAANSISFDVRFCDDYNISFSNTSILPELSNASNCITTSGAVVVKNTDNVIFEAGNEILLNGGFEVKKDGIFQVLMNGCIDK